MFPRQAHKLDMLDFFKNFAVSPDELPDVVFASIGRTVWRDIGATAVGFRLMMKACPPPPPPGACPHLMHIGDYCYLRFHRDSSRLAHAS